MRFISLIQVNNITHIIDIRSIPYSKYAPWSNKSRISDLLKPFRIRYTYLGHKLGGKQQTMDALAKQQGKTPHLIYEEAIHMLLQHSLQARLVLLCAEEDPANCHRQHFIAQSLLAAGAEVLHILKDGTLQEAWLEDEHAAQPTLF